MGFSSRSLVLATVQSLLALTAAQGDNGLVFGDDPRAPVQVDKDLMCESCHAIFDVWKKRIGSKYRTETLIYETFEEPTPICDQKNLRIYKAIPPTMQKGCEAFIDKYGEGIEDTFYQQGDAAVETVCAEVCEGIDRSEPSKPEGGIKTEGMQVNQGGGGKKKSKKKSRKSKKKKDDGEL